MNQDTRNLFGLTDRDMATFRNIFKKYPDVRLVHLFGSRAKGSFQLGSDVDLAIMNPGLSEKTLQQLNSDFEESSLPYNVDLVDYQKTTHEELRDHIDQVGKIFLSQ